LISERAAVDARLDPVEQVVVSGDRHRSASADVRDDVDGAVELHRAEEGDRPPGRRRLPRALLAAAHVAADERGAGDGRGDAGYQRCRPHHLIRSSDSANRDAILSRRRGGVER
jgi:hypothetical protein